MVNGDGAVGCFIAAFAVSKMFFGGTMGVSVREGIKLAAAQYASNNLLDLSDIVPVPAGATHIKSSFSVAIWYTVANTLIENSSPMMGPIKKFAYGVGLKMLADMIVSPIVGNFGGASTPTSMSGKQVPGSGNKPY